jgi:hypothetical protein
VATENLIAVTPPAGQLSFALVWLTDVDPGHLHVPASGNRDGQNAYWVPSPDDGSVQFGWTFDMNTLSSFNGTPGEEGGRYLTLAEKNQALSSNGVPSTPIGQ